MTATHSYPGGTALNPIAEHDRILTLDILRAVALFGVFLMNVQFFTRPLEAVGLGLESGLHGLDYALAWFEDVFMLGKFWTIFSLLFGMGFAVMAERAKQNGRGFLTPYLRRTAALAVFGVVHAVLIWSGDVLHTYAMGASLLLLILYGRWWWLLVPALIFLGLQMLGGSTRLYFTGMIVCVLFAGTNVFLRGGNVAVARDSRFSLLAVLPWGLVVLALLFGALWVGSGSFVHVAGLVSFSLLAGAATLLRGDSLTRLWRTGLVFYVIIPLAIVAVTMLMQLTPVTPTPESQAALAKAGAEQQVAISSAATIHAHGSYAENIALRWAFLRDELVRTGVFALAGIVGMFLLGVWCIRAGIMRNPQAHRSLFRRWAWFGLLLGVSLALISAAIATSYDPANSDAFTIAANLMTLANLPLSLGYIGVLVLWVHGGGTSLRLAWLAPVGRMALSNYMLQSLIGTLTFYGYGLGLWGRIDRVGQLLLVCCVFAVQIVVSRWWLVRYRFGPMEWAWRAVTYWQRPPLVRNVAGKRLPVARDASQTTQ